MHTLSTDCNYVFTVKDAILNLHMPIEKYLIDIIHPLLLRPEKAQVIKSQDEMGELLSLTLSREDMGSVIGKGGETAKCIRHLLRIAGIKHEMRVSLKITEPDGRPYIPKREVSDLSD